MRVREQQEYRAHYCGLCKNIGRRYGLVARLALNYDCTFLCAFLAATEGKVCYEKHRCLCHLGRGKQPMACASKSLDYAADVNVMLAWYAACDNWQDEKRLSALFLRMLLARAYQKAAARRPELCIEVEKNLAQLHRIERANVSCTDEPSDTFGALMRAVVMHAPTLPEAEEAACGWMFYNLGRWVYLADAWDDREKDRKRGDYNPFLTTNMDADAAAFLLYVSLTEAEKGFDLVDLPGAHGLVDNIMHLGCRMRTQQLLNKENAE